jgi:7-cyano-7-deazaguanine tRNA-ribosyltransferase
LYNKFSEYQICAYNPFIGIIPAEISDIYPAAHNLISIKKFNIHDAKAYPTFVSSFEKLLSHNYYDDVIIIADEFMQGIVHETNLEHKNLRIIEYTNNVIEQI